MTRSWHPPLALTRPDLGDVASAPRRRRPALCSRDIKRAAVHTDRARSADRHDTKSPPVPAFTLTNRCMGDVADVLEHDKESAPALGFTETTALADDALTP